MTTTMQEVMRPIEKDPRFPHAPVDWTPADAGQQAREEGLPLGDDHWETIKALQEYFARNSIVRVRELRDALDEKFHNRGGIRHLFTIFPRGPIAQGCRMAGLTPPPGTEDQSFGSVQ
jgi:TusE/DsrC/DsvC family sulfur relay protein